MKRIIVLMFSLFVFAGCSSVADDMEPSFTSFYDDLSKGEYVFESDRDGKSILIDFTSLDEYSVDILVDGESSSYECNKNGISNATSFGQTYEVEFQDLCVDPEITGAASNTEQILYDVGMFDSEYNIEYDETDDYFIAHGVNESGNDFSLKVFKDLKTIEFTEGSGFFSIKLK